MSETITMTLPTEVRPPNRGSLRDFMLSLRRANNQRQPKIAPVCETYDTDDLLAMLFGEIGEALNAARKIDLASSLGDRPQEAKMRANYTEELADCIVCLDIVLSFVNVPAVSVCPNMQIIRQEQARIIKQYGTPDGSIRRAKAILREILVPVRHNIDTPEKIATHYCMDRLLALLFLESEGAVEVIRAKFNATSRKYGAGVLL